MDLNLRENVDRSVDTFFEWLPVFVGALVILVIGYAIAKVLQGIISRALERSTFNMSLERSPAGRYIARAVDNPAVFVGRVVFWVVFIGAVSLAVSNLGIAALTAFVAAVYSYLPNVIAAVLIFLVASAVSAGTSAMVSRVMGDTPTGKLVSSVVPAITMGIAIFMILNQLQIAPAIVNITYTALIGSVALGMAIAFGLGGRDVASRMLEQAYAAGQTKVAQAKTDVRVGKARAKRTARR